LIFLVYPVAYGAYSLIRGPIVDWYPYPFLDPQVPAIAWASIFFSGILGLCIGNFLWIWGSGIIGTSRVAIFNNLSPVFAVITAYFLLGETFGPLQAAGAACVFAGVYITRNRDRFLRK